MGIELIVVEALDSFEHDDSYMHMRRTLLKIIGGGWV
jgi:hypothetical protein